MSHYQNVVILQELQRIFGLLYIGGKIIIITDFFSSDKHQGWWTNGCIIIWRFIVQNIDIITIQYPNNWNKRQRWLMCIIFNIIIFVDLLWVRDIVYRTCQTRLKITKYRSWRKSTSSYIWNDAWHWKSKNLPWQI